MSDEIRMTLLHHSTNDLIEELLMWKGLAAEKLDRIAELEAAQKEALSLLPEKEFCPNCEAETPCTHEAELFVCDICGEDFAKYIVSRNCNVSDVSMTQDVLTDVKTGQSVEIEKLQIRLSEWRGVARQLADELKEEISSKCTLIWEEVGETSPAWIAYNNLVDTEDYEANPDYYKGV